MGKDVVAAPTGIAAHNVNGLTIHGILALPVEHGSTPPYQPMSDEALKLVRDKLHNVTLYIIDEIPMVSNVTLMYRKFSNRTSRRVGKTCYSW